MGFLSGLSLVLVTLKLMGKIKTGWFLVLLPLLIELFFIPVALIVSIALFAL